MLRATNVAIPDRKVRPWEDAMIPLPCGVARKENRRFFALRTDIIRLGGGSRRICTNIIPVIAGHLNFSGLMIITII